MLWTTLKEDGTLEVRPGDSLEAYALLQWERQHKAGKAKIRIATEKMYSLEEIASMLQKDLISMRKWKQEQEAKVVAELKAD